MNRGDFVALLAATASPVPTRARGDLSAEVRLVREGDQPLAPFTVAISLHNATGRDATLVFPTADLFRIDVLRDDAPLWSSLTGHQPIPVDRHIIVPPGTLRLAQVILDGSTDDHRALPPGRFVVRVAMLGTTFGAVIDKPITIAPPLTCAEAARLRPNVVMSVEGEPIADGGFVYLHDATGRVRLSHGLGLRPSGRWIVRGYADALGDEKVFTIGRALPAYDNAVSPSPR